MKRFAALVAAIDETTRTTEKVDAMVSYFKDAAEVYEYLGGVFKVADAVDGVGESLRAADIVLRLDYSNPPASVTVSMFEMMFMVDLLFYCAPPLPSGDLRISFCTRHDSISPTIISFGLRQSIIWTTWNPGATFPGCPNLPSTLPSSSAL